MTSLYGYNTAYSSLADNNIPIPLNYEKFWIIPEIFDNNKSKDNNKDNKSKDNKNNTKLTNTIIDVLSKRNDISVFLDLLLLYPNCLNQINMYKGVVFAFTNDAAKELKLNRYDPFQLENLMRYHCSKTILAFDQLKNRKTKIKTMLDNQFLIVNNPPLREVGSQDPKLPDCTLLISNGDTWTESTQTLNQGPFYIYSDEKNKGVIKEIIECDNGIIYIIDKVLSLSYYQF